MRSRFVGDGSDILLIVPAEKGPTTRKELRRLVRKLVRKCTVIKVRRSSRPPKETRFISHFGGQPYFEEGEAWPLGKNSGQPLEGVIQIVNEGNMHLPDDVGVLQFFWDNHWVENHEIKIYPRIDRDRAVLVPKPPSSAKTRFCRLDFEPSKSLPGWESLRDVSEDAMNLSCALNDDEPWEPYRSVTEQLLGEQDYRSQIGGYPRWIQGRDTPSTGYDREMRLLLQFDSERYAHLNWVDSGLIYIFTNPEDSGELEFVMDFC